MRRRGRAVRAAAAVAALALAAACAERVDPRSPFDEDDPRALREDVELARAHRAAGGSEPAAAQAATIVTPAEEAVAIPPAGSGRRAGTIERAALVPVLDAGPAAFLSWFDVEADSRDGRFVGWRLVRVRPAGRALAELDLVPGDVLVAVNGRPLARPDHLEALWRELYGAGAVVAEIRRAGERFTLRFTIEGEPARPPATPPR